MIKKIIALLLALAMCLPIVACTVDGTGSGSDADNGGTEGGGQDDGEETQEMTAAEKEYEALIGDLAGFPVSFVYDEVYYHGFSPDSFTVKSKTDTTEGEKRSVVFELSLERTLDVTLETAFYKDYDAYEWTVYFKNNDLVASSKILECVNGADMHIGGANAKLKGILGDHENQYKPYEYDLSEQAVNFTSTLGRASHIYFPYFNLETDAGGAIIALGWAGTWQADFVYDAEAQQTHYTGAGVVGMRTYLKPGECVRTPLTAMVRYYERDEDKAMNAWRRWYVDCNMPKQSAESDDVVQPMTSAWLANDTGLPNSDGSISENANSWKRSLDALYQEQIYPDFRWFDAGWYVDPYGKTVESDWWGTVGTWELDKTKWPGDSFRESVEYGQAHGTKTFMWFEPERVTHLDGLVDNYGYKREWALSDHGNNNYYANNIGIEECRIWTRDRIIKTMTETGVDMYREDFNLDPQILFTIGDGYQGADRDGITENLYYQGHYKLWDEILAFCAETGRCTYIDSCASGGGRNDLESMRRAVPLFRSDSDRTTTSLRLAMTTTVTKWLPFTGAFAKEGDDQLQNGAVDLYVLRATYLPHMALMAAFYHEHDSIDWDVLRQAMAEWEDISRYFYEDYYVLTPYRGVTDNENWTAFMYYDEDTTSGVMQAFRPSDCTENSYTVQLRGLDPNKYYSVRDIDGVNSIERIKGSVLMQEGLELYAENARTAMILYLTESK